MGSPLFRSAGRRCAVPQVPQALSSIDTSFHRFRVIRLAPLAPERGRGLAYTVKPEGEAAGDVDMVAREVALQVGGLVGGGEIYPGTHHELQAPFEAETTFNSSVGQEERPRAESPAIAGVPLPAVYENVIVALDGSRAAAEALPHALSIARQYHARLWLLRVLPPLESTPAVRLAPSATDPAEALRREMTFRRSQAEGYIESICRALAETGLDVAPLILQGPPAQCILQVAASCGFPLVVLTAQGRSAGQVPGGERLGSVASEVLRAARIPVLLVRR